MAKNNEEVAYLVAQAGPLNGQRWALRSSLLIGRDASCDIVIPDRQVSRHHARFSLSPAGCQVEDLGSKNGTHYNGQAIKIPALLSDGDVVQVALAQQFVFISSDATLPLDHDLDEDSSGYAVSLQNDMNQAGRLRLDLRSRRVWIAIGVGEKIEEKEILPPLSVSQFQLLELLYHHPGQVVARPTLIAAVWKGEEAVMVSEQALDALIRRLRERLASIDPSHEYIITIRGHGLRLENPPV